MAVKTTKTRGLKVAAEPAGEDKPVVQDKLEKVFYKVRRGNSLYASCVAAKISTAEFYQALAQDETARAAYFLALADYADQCTDAITAIAADLKAGDIDNATAKLLIETEKWLAQKFCPDGVLERAEGVGAGDEEDKERVCEIEVKFV